jgi:hypothetical protein
MGKFVQAGITDTGPVVKGEGALRIFPVEEEPPSPGHNLSAESALRRPAVYEVREPVGEPLQARPYFHPLDGPQGLPSYYPFIASR